jgi:hypothetical protein
LTDAILDLLNAIGTELLVYVEVSLPFRKIFNKANEWLLGIACAELFPDPFWVTSTLSLSNL